jgi:ribosome-interacting GTPase 1
MPTNVSPEYKKAEAEYKRARDPADRLKWLREMLSTIPKHKGTEHVQADIKSRIKQLTDELTGPKKGGAARTGPVQAVRPEGAAQISLIGPPNAGKSALHARLTGSHAVVAPYPFTTHEPLPGMLPHLDVHFQLIDLPPVDAEYMESWYLNALQPAHAALLVVDLSDPECIDHVTAIRRRLDEKRVTLDERWPHPFDDEAAPKAVVPAVETDGDEEGEMDDPFRIVLPTLLVANKSDLDPDPEEVAVLEELLGVRYPALSVSAETGAGLDQIGPLLFAGLGVVRVYTKVPGKDPSDRPWTLFRGGTVQDVAALVHRDIAEGLRFAKVWGGSVLFEGQQVGADHALADGDVVELHV